MGTAWMCIQVRLLPKIIALAATFDIDAQIVGRVEAAEKKN
ncbi:hypothetical protein EMGBS15_15150 [Filimonas sp.]|nr:hypothetical protein EMGBS15_15150 [Filimonas sp.]